jgi:hypothetical protein
MPHPSHPGRFDDHHTRNITARWLHAKARNALVEAAATARPLTKEEAGKDPFGYQIAGVDKVCLALLPEILLHLLIEIDRCAKPSRKQSRSRREGGVWAGHDAYRRKTFDGVRYHGRRGRRTDNMEAFGRQRQHGLV